jgi:VanZ family protein
MDEPTPTTRSRIRLALSIATTALLVALAIGPFPQPDLDGAWKNLPHVIAFATLTALLLDQAVRLAETRSRPAWQGAVGLAAAVVALGVLIEIGQGMVERDATIGDVVADAIGVGLALLAWVLVRTRRAGDASPPRSARANHDPSASGSGRS